MQHVPIKSAEGKMVLAERIHLTPTYAEDILTEIAGGNLPFRFPPAAVQCRNHHSRLSTALCDPHGDGAEKRRSAPSLNSFFSFDPGKSLPLPATDRHRFERTTYTPGRSNSRLPHGFP